MWKRRRSRKKTSRNLFKIFLLFLIILVAVSIFLCFRLRLFTIKQVVIEANQLGCTDENQLKDSAGLMGQNIFFMDSSKL
ncbi:MAG: hypothetical protein M1365_14555, partial [Actinobacteria bacterium]|nr:hypothetical protein [Actinomycetota bacterium]